MKSDNGVGAAFSWLPISQLPESYLTNRKMFVVIAKDVPNYGSGLYTTDPYCVWYGDYGVNEDPRTKYKRWVHPFEPTHFCELPEF